ncbi:helicase-related protein [Clostridium botulinum]|uniref:helicase-related protein n=1 Tax=Clostridium botulinum TaxID=1491 RepID=UPI001968224C|nr:helicase-related protein [Clostridium botulinum]
MKYNYLNQNIPQYKRKEINDKIDYLISNTDLLNKSGITNEIIYNSYTLKGGLHNLNFKDFGSYHAFSERKKEIEWGAFNTNYKEAQYLIDILNISCDETVLDLTCGCGSLFNFLPVEQNIYGNELDIKAYKVAKHLYPLANIKLGDMREYRPYILFDTIIGNPPFNLRLRYDGNEQYSQMIYIKKSCELLKSGGLLALIVPKSFLDDEFSNKSDIEYMNDNFNFIGQILLDNNAFKHLGVDNFQTKIIIFSKKSDFIESKSYANTFIQGDSTCIYNTYIKPIRDLQHKYKSNIKLENIKNYSDEDKIFNERVTKLLFDIKRTKTIKDKYIECYNYYQKYYNQERPISLKQEDWDKIKITRNKVIKKLKTILSNQHVVSKDEINLVKSNYNIKLKGYSQKTRQWVFNNRHKEISINDLILNGYSFQDKTYKKLINKKRKQYNLQSMHFQDMTIDKNIEKWLKTHFLYDKLKDEKLFLNDRQLIDMNKIIQKRYGLLQWDMGGGKSFSSLFYGMYRLENNNCKNIFVVAPAIAIKNTYIDMLDLYNIKYRVIDSIQSIKDIQNGEFLLITFNMCIKYQKPLKKFIKSNNKKFALIMDESDGISNILSKRCKASINCFRKLPYKLLLSGTSTRNSINEIYGQLELLYNNSINLLSENEFIYTTDKETNELKKTKNKNYLTPFPPYKKGFELFSNSFIPKKISVFGVSKFNQDIFNKDILKNIINKTIITRSLKEIIGKELNQIHQIPCSFSSSEYDLYKTILEEFYSMSAEYQIHTGNCRKDAMFKILAQLNTLLKACSTPHTFKEYVGTNISSKIIKVFELIDSFGNERVAIGCTRIKTVNTYYNELIKRYPNRKIFRITGQDTSLKQRKELINEMKNYDNCIILSTQQSLSCSMNIGFVDKVIITEMNWNDSSCGQYRARFSRMNSENTTDIFNVFYDKSIEVNLLKLNMAKEKLCMFMKNEDIEESDLYDKYGIDSWMLKSLMIKEKDSNGSINITWGNQEII